VYTFGVHVDKFSIKEIDKFFIFKYSSEAAKALLGSNFQGIATVQWNVRQGGFYIAVTL